MKRFILSLLLFLAIFPGIFAQCSPDYPEVLRLAKESLEERDYQLAINRLLDARDICPDRKAAVNKLIRQAFEQIEGEKETAEKERKRADSVLVVIAAEKFRADSALAALVEEKQRSDSALAIANKVLDRMHFYKGRYGLAIKNVGGDIAPNYKYGFIDREGNEVIAFSFDEATQFSEEYGYARVHSGDQKFWLDTLGKMYLLAESIEELTTETRVLDLRKNKPDQWPKNIGDYTQLEVIIDPGIGALFNREGKWLKFLPESINKLQKLRILDISDNRINTLPDEITVLTGLEYLNIAANGMMTLPADIGNLEKLEYLDVSYNKLNDLPKSFWDLQSLTTIEANFNQFYRIESGIGNLVLLKNLNFSHNRIKDIPNTIGSLKSLETFNLSFNKISGLPDSFCGLNRLKTLDLTANSLPELPEKFGELIALETCLLSSNRIRVLPHSFYELDNLVVFKLDNCELEYLDEKTGNLKALRILHLGGNKLGSLPKSIGELRNLEELLLFNNQLLSLPIEAGNLENLKILNLSSNKLKEFPEVVLKLSKLNGLFLDGNEIPKIPNDVGRLNLYYFSFSENPISTLPKNFCDSRYSMQYKLIPPRKGGRRTTTPWYIQNPFQSLPECLIQRASDDSIGEVALIFLQNKFFEVAYQLIEDYSNRGGKSDSTREDLLNLITDYESRGITHPDFPAMKTLLK